jgi:hypothetical protein
LSLPIRAQEVQAGTRMSSERRQCEADLTVASISPISGAMEGFWRHGLGLRDIGGRVSIVHLLHMH